MSPDTWKAIGILIGGLATLAIFSFLWKENPYYRLFEHIYIGIGVGILAVLNVQNFLWPIAFKPVWYAITRQPLTHTGDPASYGYLLYIPFMLFGLLYYFIYSKKHGWLARVVIGFGLGSGGGLAIKAFCATFAPQIIGSFKPLLVRTNLGGFDWADSLSNLVFVLTLVCVMTYFFFSFEHDKPGIKQASHAGRWLMMIGFGAIFGTTVMARMALLVERLTFLWDKWLMQTLVGYFIRHGPPPT